MRRVEGVWLRVCGWECVVGRKGSSRTVVGNDGVDGGEFVASFDVLCEWLESRRDA